MIIILLLYEFSNVIKAIYGGTCERPEGPA